MKVQPVNSHSIEAANETVIVMKDNNKAKQQQQVLVRFQSKTHVLTIPNNIIVDVDRNDYCSDQKKLCNRLEQIPDNQHAHCLLEQLSFRTGWSTQYLKITHWNRPFINVTTKSCVLGGKGGFGTLLKGQSRQAGAKLTTDFGACRDLQGRRLRHVNDEIKLRKFKERQRREAAGLKADDDELWKTPSGIYNWHLMTPTWADISKKATYRIKRQFQQMNRQEQIRIAKRKEQDEVYQKTMTYYLEQTNSMSESIQNELNDALKQGLQKQKTKKQNLVDASVKKRKVDEITEQIVSSYDDYDDDDEEIIKQAAFEGEQPNALVSLTGEVVVENVGEDTKSIVQLQSKSDFMTAVLVLDRPITSESTTLPSYYYEVSLVTGGLAQIGWACLSGDKATFEPNEETGEGVGDDACSFAVDGSRSLKFHDGQEFTYPIEWKSGDCLGCLLEYDDDGKESSISFSLNGQDLGVAFTTRLQPLVPAFSCNQNEILELHTTKNDCKYFPIDKSNIVAVKELLTEEETIGEEKSKDSEPSEFKDEERKMQATTTEPIAKKETTIELIGNEKTTKPTSSKEPVQPDPLNLDQYNSIEELEALGFDRLKSALMAAQVKCGGTLQQRAERLFALKGLERKDYPKKVRAKDFVE